MAAIAFICAGKNKFLSTFKVMLAKLCNFDASLLTQSGFRRVMIVTFYSCSILHILVPPTKVCQRFKFTFSCKFYRLTTSEAGIWMYCSVLQFPVISEEDNMPASLIRSGLIQNWNKVVPFKNLHFKPRSTGKTNLIMVQNDHSGYVLFNPLISKG